MSGIITSTPSPEEERNQRLYNSLADVMNKWKVDMDLKPVDPINLRREIARIKSGHKPGVLSNEFLDLAMHAFDISPSAEPSQSKLIEDERIKITGINKSSKLSRNNKDSDVQLNRPWQINDVEILNTLITTEIDYQQLKALKDLTAANDDVLANWLNVDVKTLRTYRKTDTKLKENVREQLVVLLALMNHGIKVLGTREQFMQWLDTENFYFDGQKPGSFLNTVTGVRFVDDNITAMEYGDNV